MMTAVATTSIDCFHSCAAHFEGIRELILSTIKPGISYTRREISILCEIEYTCACGRVNELVAAGQLIKCGTAPRGYKNKYVGLVRLREAGDPQ